MITVKKHFGSGFNDLNHQWYLKPTPRQKAPIVVNDFSVNSAAQAMTVIAFGDRFFHDGLFHSLNPDRSLSDRSNFAVNCDDYQDFAECLKIIGDYNEFDAELILKHSAFALNLKAYFNENNGNNGRHLFDFKIAREGSPAFYVTWNTLYNNKRLTDYDNVEATADKPAGTVLYWEQYTAEDFKNSMEQLAGAILADEFYIDRTDFQQNEHSHTLFTARFWFD